MRIHGSLMEAITKYRNDGVKVVILVIDESDDDDILKTDRVAGSPEPGMGGALFPATTVTSHQQRVILLSHRLDCEIYLVQFIPKIPAGMSRHHARTSTRAALRALLPEDALTLNKHCFGAFWDTGLLLWLRAFDISHIVVMGWNANVCVKYTVGQVANNVLSDLDIGALSYGFTVLSCQQVLHGSPADWANYEKVEFYSHV